MEEMEGSAMVIMMVLLSPLSYILGKIVEKFNVKVNYTRKIMHFSLVTPFILLVSMNALLSVG